MENVRKLRELRLVFEIGLEPKRSRETYRCSISEDYSLDMFIENRIKNENETDN